jgi:hypothetical protein
VARVVALSEREIAEQVAAYIAKHGVTKCPAAAVTETTAVISPEDRAAHAALGYDHLGEAWRRMTPADRFRRQVNHYWAKRRAGFK